MSAARADAPTLGGLPLPHRAIVVMCVLAIAVMVALALFSLASTTTPIPSLIAITVFIVGGGVLASSARSRLSGRLTALGVALPTVITLICGWTTMGEGFARWYLGAGALTLLLLALRMRIGWAWIGATALLVSGTVVGVATGLSVATSIDLVLRQIALLAVGTVFAVGIRGTQRRLVELERSALTDAVRTASERAAESARTERLEWAHLLSTSLLERLSAGDEITAEMRQDARLTEAELRDGLRGAGLAQGPVPAAARAARARGCEVVLLDDRGDEELDLDDQARIHELVAHALVSLHSGRLVARLLPAGRATLATVSSDGDPEIWLEYPEPEGPGEDVEIDRED